MRMCCRCDTIEDCCEGRYNVSIVKGNCSNDEWKRDIASFAQIGFIDSYKEMMLDRVKCVGFETTSTQLTCVALECLLSSTFLMVVHNSMFPTGL